MKKMRVISAAALCCVSSMAMAQTATAPTTSVTLYGLVDASFNHVSGLKNGSFNGIASGVMEGSRFGLRGNEDLGGGYRAIFTLENRFEVDTGALGNRTNSGTQLPDRMSTASGLGLTGTAAAVAAGVLPGVTTAIGNTLGVNVANNLFDRQAFVGLVTPFGAFTLGRQYTPAYLTGATFDASQTQSSLAAGQAATFPPAFDIRLSNTLQYGIQAAGVTATLMYGAGEVTGRGNSAGRFYGGMAMYKGDGFSVGYGRNQRNNELGQKSLGNNVFGASVNLGPGALYGQYTTIKDDNPGGLSTIGGLVANNATLIGTPGIGVAGAAALGSAYQAAFNNAFRQDARLMHVGYRFTIGASTIVVAYNRLNDRRASNADTDSYGATYTYALSKRTNLNAVLTRFNNKGNGQAAPGGNGFLGGVTSAAGVDSTNFAVGVRHTF